MRNGIRVKDIVAEPLRAHGVRDQSEIGKRGADDLEEMSLTPAQHFLSCFPNELSGGQRQRVAFARAIVSCPKMIIADEPTSMLDVFLRGEMLELMELLRKNHDVGYLFITYALALARRFCDRFIVLNNGKAVEEGPSDLTVNYPTRPYTKALLEAVDEPEFLEPCGTLTRIKQGG